MEYIKCPICGEEFMPAEVFLPTDLLGKPTEIIKTHSGKIEFFLGDEPDFEESYVCDGCGSKLKIKANLSFKVELEEEKFEEEYVTTFNKPGKLELEEVDLFND